MLCPPERTTADEEPRHQSEQCSFVCNHQMGQAVVEAMIQGTEKDLNIQLLQAQILWPSTPTINHFKRR